MTVQRPAKATRLFGWLLAAAVQMREENDLTV